jgi:hypothetical protein
MLVAWRARTSSQSRLSGKQPGLVTQDCGAVLRYRAVVRDVDNVVQRAVPSNAGDRQCRPGRQLRKRLGVDGLALALELDHGANALDWLLIFVLQAKGLDCGFPRWQQTVSVVVTDFHAFGVTFLSHSLCKIANKNKHELDTATLQNTAAITQARHCAKPR